MKAFRIYGGYTAQCEDLPDPEIGPGRHLGHPGDQGLRCATGCGYRREGDPSRVGPSAWRRRGRRPDVT